MVHVASRTMLRQRVKVNMGRVEKDCNPMLTEVEIEAMADKFVESLVDAGILLGQSMEEETLLEKVASLMEASEVDLNSEIADLWLKFLTWQPSDVSEPVFAI